MLQKKWTVKKYSPCLPVELWEKVFMIMLRPRFAIDITCRPGQIEAYYEAISSPGVSNRYYGDFAGECRRLRLVSKYWNSIASDIKQSWLFVSAVGYGTPVDLTRIERLDTIAWEALASSSKDFLPTSLEILNIQLSAAYTPKFPQGLLTPGMKSRLRVLHLQTHQYNNECIIRSIHIHFPFLETLSLDLVNFQKGELYLPRLKNLFLSLSSATYGSSTSVSSQMESLLAALDVWNFPELCSFVFHSTVPYKVPQALQRFINLHGKQLTTLSIKPRPPVNWPFHIDMQKLPHLKCLGIYLHHSYTPMDLSFTSLDHIIIHQTGQWNGFPLNFINNPEYIPLSVSKLSLPISPKLADKLEKLKLWDASLEEAISSFDAFCERRNIELFDEEDRCFTSLMKYLRSDKVPTPETPKSSKFFSSLMKLVS